MLLVLFLIVFLAVLLIVLLIVLLARLRGGSSRLIGGCARAFMRSGCSQDAHKLPQLSLWKGRPLAIRNASSSSWRTQ